MLSCGVLCWVVVGCAGLLWSALSYGGGRCIVVLCGGVGWWGASWCVVLCHFVVCGGAVCTLVL